MTTRQTLSMLTVVLLVSLTGCANGPTGADPGQELKIEYPGGLAGQTLTERKTGEAILTGSVEPLQRLVTLSSRATNFKVEFQGGQAFNALQKPTIALYFNTNNPANSGTQTWTEVDLSSGEPTGTPTNGVLVRVNAVNYYPVEGSTTVQTGYANSDTQIGGVVGYFNGKLRSADGQTITVQSCKFSHPAP